MMESGPLENNYLHKDSTNIHNILLYTWRLPKKWTKLNAREGRTHVISKNYLLHLFISQQDTRGLFRNYIPHVMINVNLNWISKSKDKMLNYKLWTLGKLLESGRG